MTDKSKVEMAQSLMAISIVSRKLARQIMEKSEKEDEYVKGKTVKRNQKRCRKSYK
ncbi:hypothetical protein [Miniphocaeibacter massiliensis]|uniref:hypothetical protein n=1 Tax=Miniphocaeibacter massiliensis TaxID=2041841 RepID=UPI0013EAC7DB|nr:hypothetical protein [Miniphocaeibacter massiliensis]